SHPSKNRHAHAKDGGSGMVQNDEALEINLDLLEEKREQAAILEAKSKVKMEKYYNSKVCNMSFVGIKSLLNAASITAAHIRVNAAQLC
ncbi:hypothetical protein Tco_1095828, partial [Tanacetum coccineum]